MRSKFFWAITHEVIGELFRAMNTDCRAAAKEVTDTKLARETKAGSSLQLCLWPIWTNEKKARESWCGT